MYYVKECPFKDKYCEYACKLIDGRIVCTLCDDMLNELCFYSSLVNKKD